MAVYVDRTFNVVTANEVKLGSSTLAEVDGELRINGAPLPDMAAVQQALATAATDIAAVAATAIAQTTDIQLRNIGCHNTQPDHPGDVLLTKANSGAFVILQIDGGASDVFRIPPPSVDMAGARFYLICTNGASSIVYQGDDSGVVQQTIPYNQGATLFYIDDHTVFWGTL
jgi:hypothetical protein